MVVNAYVRQLDEIAAREGCHLPVSLLRAMVRLFDEALDSRFETTAAAGARYEFTRCGAIDDAALIARLRCVRRRGHAGKHFAADGERWGNEAIAGGTTSASVDRLTFCVSPVAAQLPLTGGSATATAATDSRDVNSQHGGEIGE